MAELIDKVAFRDHWNKNFRHQYANDTFLFAIANFPTVDAVPVVRCKDCKHNNMNGGDCTGIITMYHYDPVLELNVAEYIKLEHCSHGERRTDD